MFIHYHSHCHPHCYPVTTFAYARTIQEDKLGGIGMDSNIYEGVLQL
jgi:hypothetical protein